MNRVIKFDYLRRLNYYINRITVCSTRKRRVGWFLNNLKIQHIYMTQFVLLCWTSMSILQIVLFWFSREVFPLFREQIFFDCWRQTMLRTVWVEINCRRLGKASVNLKKIHLIKMKDLSLSSHYLNCLWTVLTFGFNINVFLLIKTAPIWITTNKTLKNNNKSRKTNPNSHPTIKLNSF